MTKEKYNIVLSLLLLVLFLPNTIHAQKDSSFKVRVDTLRIQSIASKADSKWDLSTVMPWASAIFIAVLGVAVNLHIAKRTREISISVIKEQVRNSTRLAASQFKATLYSSNRQEWINSVRETISELVSQCTLLNIAFRGDDVQRKQVIFEKVLLYKSKLQLFLSPKIPSHKQVLDNLIELMTILGREPSINKWSAEDSDFSGVLKLSEKIIESGRDLLYEEWGKIQKGDGEFTA